MQVGSPPWHRHELCSLLVLPNCIFPVDWGSNKVEVGDALNDTGVAMLGALDKEEWEVEEEECLIVVINWEVGEAQEVLLAEPCSREA